MVGASPGFRDEAAQDFRLAAGSANLNTGAPLAAVVLPEPGVGFEYVKHQGSKARSSDGVLDIGAFELEDGQPPPVPDLVVTTSSLAGGTVGTFYSASLAASGGVAPYCLEPGERSAARRTVAVLDRRHHRHTHAIRKLPVHRAGDGRAGARRCRHRGADADRRRGPATTAARAHAEHHHDQPAVGKAGTRTTRGQLAANGGVAPYSWRVAVGSLPPGLTLNASTGVISGKATTIGTSAFTAEVRDSRSPAVTDTQALSITVTR